jgi:hypothetical protein
MNKMCDEELNEEESGFCLIKYCDENCEQLGDWTECQEGQSVVSHGLC